MCMNDILKVGEYRYLHKAAYHFLSSKENLPFLGMFKHNVSPIPRNEMKVGAF